VPQTESEIPATLSMRERELARSGLVRRLELERETARFDTKTGVLNPRAWVTEVVRQLGLDGRSSDPNRRDFILLADLDHFKIVNDTLGHLKGDEVLRQVGHAANQMLMNIRGGGAAGKNGVAPAVGRFGGEEFVFWIPDTDETGAFAIAERFRTLINQIGYTDNDGIPVELNERSTVGISTGVAEVFILNGDPFKSVNIATRNADMAMYAAKKGGRNSTYLFTSREDVLAQPWLEEPVLSGAG